MVELELTKGLQLLKTKYVGAYKDVSALSCGKRAICGALHDCFGLNVLRFLVFSLSILCMTERFFSIMRKMRQKKLVLNFT